MQDQHPPLTLAQASRQIYQWQYPPDLIEGGAQYHGEVYHIQVHHRLMGQ